MTAAAHVRSFDDTLWDRVLARFHFGRALTRPRVPLVLRRTGVSTPIRAAADRRPTARPQHHLALHVHLSWPQWLGRQEQRQAISAQPVLGRTLIQRRATRTVTVDTAPVAPRTNVSRQAPASWPRTVAVRPSSAAASDLNGAPRIGRSLLERIAAVRSVLAPVRQPMARRGLGVDAERASGIGAKTIGRAIEPRVDRETELGSGRAPVDTTLFTSVRRRVRVWTTQAEAGTTQLATQRVTPTVTARHRHAPSTSFVHAAPVAAKVHANPDGPQGGAPIERTAPPRRPELAAAPLNLNVERLSEEVYRHIQKRMRIERERRGL